MGLIPGETGETFRILKEKGETIRRIPHPPPGVSGVGCYRKRRSIKRGALGGGFTQRTIEDEVGERRADPVPICLAEAFLPTQNLPGNNQLLNLLGS
ncbi:MAG: hypothetical protein COZ69_08830, partial [Deltaproteobacteria bacterium CG_4_8_14_3_um_filter_45_9]